MLHALGEISLFKDLDTDELDLLEPLFEFYTCPAGTIIFEQGGQTRYLYVLLNGIVEIRYKPYDGPAITVTRVLEGGAFGWSAAIGSVTYTSSAQCIEECEALRIHGNDLRMLCTQHPETGKIILDRLAQLVSARWRDARAQVRALLNQDIEENVGSLRSKEEES